MNDQPTYPATGRPAPVIETERLRLRPFSRDDIDRLFECARNPVIGDRAGWKPHETRDESETILDQLFMDKETIWAIELCKNNLFVGTAGFMPDPKREGTGLQMIGYWLDENFWGRHLMREAVHAILHHAFRTLQMPAVTATCYPDNDRSHKLLLGEGFIHEGTLRMADKAYDGSLRDLLSFILTREDFLRADISK